MPVCGSLFGSAKNINTLSFTSEKERIDEPAWTWQGYLASLPDEAIDILTDLAPEGEPGATNGDVRTLPSGSFVAGGECEQALREFLSAALAKKLPQLLEYQEKGYNTPGPDREGMARLQALLQEHDYSAYGDLTAPAAYFLETLYVLMQAEEPFSPEFLATLPLANAVTRHLYEALEALIAAVQTSKLDWQQEVKSVVGEQREKLVTAALDTLANTAQTTADRRVQQQRLQGVLHSENFILYAEHKKFSLLKNSLLAESRFTRQRLAEQLQHKATTLLAGAREAREGALAILLVQVQHSFRQMNPEQLIYWSQQYQHYARHLRATDGEPERLWIQSNPLIAAVSSKPPTVEPTHIQLARAIVPAAEMLGWVSVYLAQERSRIVPQEGVQAWVGNEQSIPEMVRKRAQKVKATSAHLARSTGSTLCRALHHMKHKLLPAQDPDGFSRAISNTVLLLVDEIQQMERRLILLPSYAWLMQEAVEQQLRVSGDIVALEEAFPPLSALLTQQLGRESMRWQTYRQQAAEQITTLLEPLIRLADKEGKDNFYALLSGTLWEDRTDGDTGKWEDLHSTDTMMLSVIGQLGGIGCELRGCAVRLAGHGHEGGKALREKLNGWLMALKTLKAQVKLHAVSTTGRVADNFSRSGMLTRGISEWAESLKQAYLKGLPVRDQAAATEIFDSTLLALMQEQSSLFAKKADPQGKGFHNRLALALKHAAHRTTVYPPTPQEILAGTRGLSADIQHWAEKKVVNGALSAAFAGGFRLVTGPITLPVRAALRGIYTGRAIYKGLHTMNRVRLGETPATDIKSHFINQELAKMAFRLTLSISPTISYGMAVSITGTRLWKAQNKRTKMLKNIMMALPDELLWRGAFAGGYAGANAALCAHTDRELAKCVEAYQAYQNEVIAAQLLHADDEQRSSLQLELVDTITACENLQKQVAGRETRDEFSDLLTAQSQEGGIYKFSANKYIYLNQQYLPFYTPGADLAAIHIKENETEKLLLVCKQQQQWDVLEEVSIAEHLNVKLFFDRLHQLNGIPEVRRQILFFTSHSGYSSWKNFLLTFQAILDDEFYKRYHQPDDENLRVIMILKSSLSLWLQLFGVENSGVIKSNVSDISLSRVYQEVFSNDIQGYTTISAVGHWQRLAKEEEKKIEQFSANICKNSQRIERLTSELRQAYNTNSTFNEQKEMLDFDQLDYDEEEKFKSSKKDEVRKLYSKKIALDDVNKALNIRKEESDEKLQYYKSHYRSYEAGILYAQKILLREGMQRDELEMEVLDLSLREVNIRIQERDFYTPDELSKLDEVRVARLLIMSHIERQFVFHDIVKELGVHYKKLNRCRGDYSDILRVNEQADTLHKDIFGQQESVASRFIIAPILYWLLKNKGDVSALKDMSIEYIIDHYYIDAHRLNPLAEIKSIPEGYVALSGMLENNFFSSQFEYNQQFADYKNKYSAFEASENTRLLLLTSELSLDDIILPVKKRFRFKVLTGNNVYDRNSGEMLFVQLHDGRWVFFSIFSGATLSRIFTQEQMNNDIWLKHIANLQPKFIHYHGIESVFTEYFFTSNFDSKNINGKSGEYKDRNQRIKKLKGDFIDGVLYKNDGDIIYNNPFNHSGFNGLVYHFDENDKQPRETLVKTLHISFDAVLRHSADTLKKGLYQPSVLQKMANTLIPFYAEIYGAATDSEHQPNANSIMLDLVGVLFAGAQAGAKIATMFKNSKGLARLIQEGTKKGLSGKGLHLYVMQELGKEGLFQSAELAKISSGALFDLIDPFSSRDIYKYAVSGTRSALSAQRSIPFAIAQAGKTTYIIGKYVRTNTPLVDLNKQILHGGEVYSRTVVESGIKEYYIKYGENIYQVRWDDSASTWRMVDADNPGRLSYGEPVVYKNGVWGINKIQMGACGGGITAIPVDTKKVLAGGLSPENPLRTAARRSRRNENIPAESWDYVTDLLEDAKLLNKEMAISFRAKLSLAAKGGFAEAQGLFSSSRIIDSEEKLLAVKHGEIVVFREGNRTIHTMISLGNGRFAGVKNSALNTSLSDAKSILTAEQLVEFRDNTFICRRDGGPGNLQIIAGKLQDTLLPDPPSLKSLAEQIASLADEIDLAAKSAELLATSGQLTLEQATALQEKLTFLLKAAKGNSPIAGTIESLFVSVVKVADRASLQAIEKGKLVVFGNRSSPSFSAHHLMYSLGDGDFMMINPHLLDKRLVSKNGIINASQFTDDILTKYGVLTGDISLSQLRMASLLGRDAAFFVDGPVLTVRLHGAPGTANFMDAYELAEVIRGLGLRKSTPLQLGAISEIKLESCYGAFGFLPTGEALAHILNKKVTAYPFRFSQAIRHSRNFLTRPKVYLPLNPPPTDIVLKIEQQQSRNHDFWNRLLGMYVAAKGKRVRRDTEAFDALLNEVAAVVHGEIDVTAFLAKFPQYKNEYADAESDLNAIIAGEITNPQHFAQRCIDILTMCTYSADLLDKYLGSEQS